MIRLIFLLIRLHSLSVLVRKICCLVFNIHHTLILGLSDSYRYGHLDRLSRLIESAVPFRHSSGVNSLHSLLDEVRRGLRGDTAVVLMTRNSLFYGNDCAIALILRYSELVVSLAVVVESDWPALQGIVVWDGAALL